LQTTVTSTSSRVGVCAPFCRSFQCDVAACAAFDVGSAPRRACLGELQARVAVVDQRARIARELHDVLAHNVSMIIVQAGAAARVLEGEQPDAREALAAIEVTGGETVDERRRLLGVLRRAEDRPALAPQPTLRERDALAAHVREAGLPDAADIAEA
jgi:signal transduction histidine kinase